MHQMALLGQHAVLLSQLLLVRGHGVKYEIRGHVWGQSDKWGRLKFNWAWWKVNGRSWMPRFDCGLVWISQSRNLCFHHTCSFQHWILLSSMAIPACLCQQWTGDGEQDTKRSTRVLVGVGCNPGRSFITLCLLFAVFASEAAHGWGKVYWSGTEDQFT